MSLEQNLGTGNSHRRSVPDTVTYSLSWDTKMKQPVNEMPSMREIMVLSSRLFCLTY